MVNKVIRNYRLVMTNCLYKKTDTGRTPYRLIKKIFYAFNLTRKGI